MQTCVHGDICRAWMMSDRTRGNAPLVCTCPNGCKFFEAKFSNKSIGLCRENYNYLEQLNGAYRCAPNAYIR